MPAVPLARGARAARAGAALVLALVVALGGCAGLPGAGGWAGTAAGRPLTLPVERPVLRVGDRWVYSGRELGDSAHDGRTLLERTVTRVAGDRVELRQVPLDASTRRPSGAPRVRNAKPAVWHLEPGGRSSGEIRSLAFPLVPGKHWEYEYWQAGDADVVTTYRYQARVEAVETVRTPAGRFETLRVVHRGEWSRPVLERGQPALRSGAVTTTYWYAPVVGAWVRLEVDLRRPDGGREFGVVQELVEFARAP